MIRVQLIDPEALPPRIPGIAVHRPGDILFLMKRGLTEEQLAHWIGVLGGPMTREAVDATVHRDAPAAEQEVRVRALPRRIPHT